MCDGSISLGSDGSSSSVHIEVGDPNDIEEGEFAPSAVGEDDVGTYGSITTTVQRHAYENGRRYHKFRYGTYPIPNDDTEQARDELKHALTLELTGGRLYFAPIGDYPQRIIDLGTGTGSWPIGMADRFPSAQVIGIDLSPIQEPWVPPNLQFFVEDMHDPWLHGDDFDLIHLRHVTLVIRELESILDKALEHLRPGGWIEIHEFGGCARCDDGSMGPDSPFKIFMDKIAEALSNAYDFRWRVANVMGEILRQRGFTNVGCKKFKAPIGRWPRNRKLRLVGEYMRQITEDLMDALAAKPLREVMSGVEAEELVAAAKVEFNDHETHLYLDYFFWYAQKPTTC